MTRASRLAPDDRRRALIDATRPLLLGQGPNVSTRQIAEAAGVAEGTIFRVFETKAELVDAVLEDALSPEATVEALRAIPAGLGLADTVLRIVEIQQESVRRIRALLVAVAEPSCPPGRPPLAGPRRHEREQVVGAAVEAVLDRFRGELRVTPAAAAWALRAFAFAAVHPFTDDPALTEPRQVAGLLLNGIAHHPC